MSMPTFVQCGLNLYEVHGSGSIAMLCTRNGQSPEEAWAEAQQPQEPDYRDQRLREYPALNDQMDQVAKLALALRAAGILPPVDESVHEWLDRIAAVKAAYPKGDQ